MKSLPRWLAVLALVALAFVPAAWGRPGAGAGAPKAAPSSSAKPSDSQAAHSFTDSMPCSACHTTTSWRAQGSDESAGKFDHSKTGFPLTGQHRNTPCVGCHNATAVVKRDCVSCHEDFHRGRLSQACDRCHSAVSFRITKPLELHRMTRFPLTGMHALADCSECHRRASERRFTDAPVACFACHEKDYRRPGIFPVHAGTAKSAPLPRDCSLCHRPIAWVPAVAVGGGATATAASALEVAPPNHDVLFPLSFGSHRTAACPDCHASTAVPSAVRCIGCHTHDPVRLSQQHRAHVALDGAACLSCHVGGARR